jgi:hypothetical protein
MLNTWLPWQKKVPESKICKGWACVFSLLLSSFRMMTIHRNDCNFMLSSIGTLHARNQALRIVTDKSVVDKLFNEFPQRFADRSGGSLSIQPLLSKIVYNIIREQI